MDIVYAMPNQPSRLFVNVVHTCPNACLFCVDFKGDTFYGFDLKRGRPVTAEQIGAAVQNYPGLARVREVYFCGIGEPLLCYENVVQGAIHLRRTLATGVMLGINTSGTFYHWNPRVDFAKYFDLIQVSLNAESAEKYEQICRPKFRKAYETLMMFLRHLRQFIDESGLSCGVELSIVDTSETEYLPDREKSRGDIPKPDFDDCRKIADNFRWPLKVKRLMRDFEQKEWIDFAEGTRSRFTCSREYTDAAR